MVTISQMTPGRIAFHYAAFVGIKIAGIPGTIIVTLCCILPSCIIVAVISYVYMKYRHLLSLQDILNMLRPAAIFLIVVAGLTI